MDQESNQLAESLDLIATNKDAKISRIKKLKRNEEERKKKLDLVLFSNRYSVEHYSNFCTSEEYYRSELSIGVIIKVLGNYQFIVCDEFKVKFHASLPSSLHHYQYHGLDIGNIVSLQRNELGTHFICGKVDQHYLLPYKITKFQSYLTDNKTFKQFCEEKGTNFSLLDDIAKDKAFINLSVYYQFSTLFISKMKEKLNQMPTTLFSSAHSQILNENMSNEKKLMQNSRKTLKIGIISFFILLCTLHDIYTLESQQDVHFITSILLPFSPYNKIGMLLYQMFHSSFCSLPSKNLMKRLPIELTGEIISYLKPEDLHLEEILLYFTSFLFKECVSTNQLKYFLNLQYMGKRRLKKLFKNLRSFDKNEINSAMKNEEVQEAEEESSENEDNSEDDRREESQRINESWYDGDHDIRNDRYRIEKFEGKKENHNAKIDLDTMNHLKVLLDSRIPYYMSVFCFSTEFPLM